MRNIYFRRSSISDLVNKQESLLRDIRKEVMEYPGLGDFVVVDWQEFEDAMQVLAASMESLAATLKLEETRSWT